MGTFPWVCARRHITLLIRRTLTLTCEVIAVGALLLVATLGWALTGAGVVAVKTGPLLADLAAIHLPHLPTLPPLTVVAGGGVR